MVNDFDEVAAGYARFARHIDEWAADSSKSGRVVAVPAEGEPLFFANFEEAYASLRAKGLLGRVHIGLVYPWSDGRRQPAWPRYRTSSSSGFILNLKIQRAEMDVPINTLPEKALDVPFVVDTGADITCVPEDKLAAIGAPIVGAARFTISANQVGFAPLYLVAITNGASSLRLDPWVVQALPRSDGLLGRDALSRCRIEYPVEGKLKVVFAT